MSTVEIKPIAGLKEWLPTEQEVNRISTLMDPVNRNLQITACYKELSSSFAVRTGLVANWCTFATWASRQAGVTIRKEDLKHKMEEILTGDPAIKTILDLINIYSKQLSTGNIHQSIHLEALHRMIESAANKASDAVARGNKKVFEEIGLEFARFIHTCLKDEPYNEATITSFCSALRPGLPPDGQHYLSNAFTRYYKAFYENIPKKQDELILMANIEIGLHEQTRLQPEIAASLNAAMIDQTQLTKFITDLLVHHSNMKGKIFYFFQWITGRTSLLKKAINQLANLGQSRLRIILTKHMMMLTLPPGDCLHLGDDLLMPYPVDLHTIEYPDLINLLKQLKPSPDAIEGKGCTDWADLNQRIFYIAHLFRCYHENQHLFDDVFTSGQLEKIRNGEVPAGI